MIDQKAILPIISTSCANPLKSSLCIGRLARAPHFA
jgi:hypothetical protein